MAARLVSSPGRVIDGGRKWRQDRSWRRCHRGASAQLEKGRDVQRHLPAFGRNATRENTHDPVLAASGNVFCMACGVALPEGAGFCHRCGVEQTNEALNASRQGSRIEICEITKRDAGLFKWAFVAQGVGR